MLDTVYCKFIKESKVIKNLYYPSYLLSDSFVSDSLQPMDCRPQDSLLMEFPRQEHWSGLPFPSSGDHSNPGIKPGSPALQADSFFFFLIGG